MLQDGRGAPYRPNGWAWMSAGDSGLIILGIGRRMAWDPPASSSLTNCGPNRFVLGLSISIRMVMGGWLIKSNCFNISSNVYAPAPVNRKKWGEKKNMRKQGLVKHCTASNRVSWLQNQNWATVSRWLNCLWGSGTFLAKQMYPFARYINSRVNRVWCSTLNYCYFLLL